MANNDIITSIASKLSPTIKIIVQIQCDLHCLTALSTLVIPGSEYMFINKIIVCHKLACITFPTKKLTDFYNKQLLESGFGFTVFL